MNWESAPKRWIRTQIRRDFLRLVLKNHRPRGFERMVVRQRQIDGLIESDRSRSLGEAGTLQRQEYHACCEQAKPLRTKHSQLQHQPRRSDFANNTQNCRSPHQVAASVSCSCM